MVTTLLILALAGLPGSDTDQPATQPAAAEGSAALTERPAPPSTADTIVAAAFAKGIDTSAANEKDSAPASIGWSSFVAPGLALLGLAGLALGLTRRRRAAAGSIHVLEVASLGPKRSLVIADVLGDRLVLGVSEAGVAVLSTRPAPLEAAGAELEGVTIPAPTAPTRAVAPMGFFARLVGRTPTAPFEEVLGESVEDRELRAKLAQGVRGVVP